MKIKIFSAAKLQEY